jgi:hypothetical protein
LFVKNCFGRVTIKHVTSEKISVEIKSLLLIEKFRTLISSKLPTQEKCERQTQSRRRELPNEQKRPTTTTTATTTNDVKQDLQQHSGPVSAERRFLRAALHPG